MAIKKKAGRLSPTPMGDYDNTTIYRRLDWVYYGGTSYICKRNNTIGIVPSDTEKWQKLIELPTELDMIFDEVTTRENITSGDKLSVILGKIKKLFSDLENVAFSGSYNDLSDTPNSLKNPNKLNIKLNGASQISYDGSIAKEIDVTPSAISAVNTSTILTTKEQISANTNSSSVTGALAAKAMMTDYNDKITQLNSDLYYKPGDVIGRKYGIWICGTLTGGNSEIWVTIPYNKPILGAPKVTLIPLEFIVRQNGTYLVNISTKNDFVNSGIKIETNRLVNGIGFTAKFTNSNTNGFGGTNNDVVSVYMAYDITFT